MPPFFFAFKIKNWTKVWREIIRARILFTIFHTYKYFERSPVTFISKRVRIASLFWGRFGCLWVPRSHRRGISPGRKFRHHGDFVFFQFNFSVDVIGMGWNGVQRNSLFHMSIPLSEKNVGQLSPIFYDRTSPGFAMFIAESLKVPLRIFGSGHLIRWHHLSPKHIRDLGELEARIKKIKIWFEN